MTTPQTLLIDGDDTLWENNVYFEEAIESFLDYLRHSSLDRQQVRSVLDEVERLNSRVHGYGAAAFSRNLRQTYERLAQRRVEPGDLDYLMMLGKRILEREIQLLPGVSETLSYLGARHRRAHREGRAGLPRPDPRLPSATSHHLDGRQLATFRYQPGSIGRAQRRIHPPSSYLAAGGRVAS